MNITKTFSAKTFKSLCTPAQLYVGLSVLSLIALVVQNCLDPYNFCIGSFRTRSTIESKIVYLVLKVAYILFWSWVINKACKKGWNKLAWLILLFPFVAGFVLSGVLFLLIATKNGKKNNTK